MSANHIFKSSCDFIAGATSIDSLPPMSFNEIAFAGLSNVGKSSLINAVTGRKALAKTSQTPGRTRQLNFFNIADKLILVDLPGYGYAKASKKDISSWTKLTRKYLCGRSSLRRVFLLIDIRRGLKDSDKEYMAMFDEAAVAYQIILTKSDKVKDQEMEDIKENILSAIAKHPAALPEIIITSSEKGTGINKLRMAITNIASQ